MPFVPSTPEAHICLLTTPPDTCHGITNLGTACTKKLTRTTASGVPAPGSGIITTIGNRSTYFCAKHQDQAKNVVLRHTASFSRRRALVGRGSLDTLIEQVEVLVGPQKGGKGKGRTQTVKTHLIATTTKVPRKDDPFRPAASSSEDDSDLGFDGAPGRPPTPPKNKKKKKTSFWRRLLCGCCAGPLDDEDGEPAAYTVNEKKWSEKQREAELRQAATGVVGNEYPSAAGGRAGKQKTARVSSVAPTPVMPMTDPRKHGDMKSAMKKSTAGGRAPPVGATPATALSSEEEDDGPVVDVDLSNLTKEERKLISLIPTTLPAKAQAKLRTELLRPFSDKDEPGYIYMFWLTDSPLSPFSTPSPSEASTPNNILSGTSATSAGHRLSAYLDPNAPARPKLLFKIGRAVNVQRRLHQWSTQCGYNLALIRYYPHTSATSPPPKSSPGILNGQSTSSSPATTPSGTPLGRKVPNVNRVERLIHLELGATPGANPAIGCNECGKTHKEWFEIDASREGVLGVDLVVKKWIAYAEGGAAAALDVLKRDGGATKMSGAAIASGSGAGAGRRPDPPARKEATSAGIPHATGLAPPPPVKRPAATTAPTPAPAATKTTKPTKAATSGTGAGRASSAQPQAPAPQPPKAAKTTDTNVKMYDRRKASSGTNSNPAPKPAPAAAPPKQKNNSNSNNKKPNTGSGSSSNNTAAPTTRNSNNNKKAAASTAAASSGGSGGGGKRNTRKTTPSSGGGGGRGGGSGAGKGGYAADGTWVDGASGGGRRRGGSSGPRYNTDYDEEYWDGDWDPRNARDDYSD